MGGIVYFNVDGMRQSLTAVQTDVRAMRTDASNALAAINATLMQTNATLATAATGMARQEERTATLNDNLSKMISQLNGIGADSSNAAKSISNLDARMATSLARQDSFQRVVIGTMLCDAPNAGQLPGGFVAICQPEAKIAAIRVWLAANP